jgi:glycerol-3-phosphate dehydrogenase
MSNSTHSLKRPGRNGRIDGRPVEPVTRMADFAMVPSNSSMTDTTFDIAVIGGGVVGCATARRFALAGARVVLLEKGADILSGASKGNSAILHTGFDAPPDSIELACMKAGYAEYMAIREELGLPLLETGALVVAWSNGEHEKLASMAEKALANGIEDVRLTTADELRRMEPNLAENALGAVHVPREHLIDPWSAPLAYLKHAMSNGAKVYRNAEVLSGRFDGNSWHLDTKAGPVQANHVANCAGLYGDVVDKALTGQQAFSIMPRKGQFIVFDKLAHDLISAIILPVPDERTKGIVMTRTIFGNLLVGPTAEDQQDRDRASVDTAVLRQLQQTAIRIVPALEGIPVVATYAGLRPATEEKAYRMRYDADRHLLVAGGIRSTGLTAALGIGRHLFDLYSRAGNTHAAPRPIHARRVPNLAEHVVRDWQQPGYGEIVCHCEMVTRREIEAALAGDLPAGDIGGLRRRTRAGMGRCQGFYCNAKLAAMTGDRLATPLAVGNAS